MLIYVSSSLQPSYRANSIQSFYQYAYLSSLYSSSCYFHASSGKHFIDFFHNHRHKLFKPRFLGLSIHSTSIFPIACSAFIFVLKRIFLSLIRLRLPADHIYSRNIYFSFLLLVLRISHIFEIHTIEVGKVQSFFLKSILSSPFISKVFISVSLKEHFPEQSIIGRYYIEHDASLPLDLSDTVSRSLASIFSFSSVSSLETEFSEDKKIRFFYAGTFAQGRGIELIFALASCFPNCDFILAGDSSDYTE